MGAPSSFNFSFNRQTIMASLALRDGRGDYGGGGGFGAQLALRTDSATRMIVKHSDIRLVPEPGFDWWLLIDGQQVRMHETGVLVLDPASERQIDVAAEPGHPDWKGALQLEVDNIVMLGSVAPETDRLLPTTA